MLTLGIETSCDETGLALVRDGELVAERLASQEDVHAVFGGVVPELASREHLRLLPYLLDELFKGAGVNVPDVDLVATARGPGLLGSLLVGMGLAKGLALATNTPLVGVNHLWAHLLAPGLEQELIFPAMGVLVSGGHTHIYLMHSATEIELLGQTIDDAAGEAFDKVAKLLNLPYPGGRHIDELASRGTPDKLLFPRPYLNNQNLDFSFSGLKTAVAVYLNDHPELRQARMEAPAPEQNSSALQQELFDVCASFNWAVAATLHAKTERALKRQESVRALVVAGGVAANSHIRRTMQDLADSYDLPLILPSPELCTDNASMVAFAGELLYRAGWCHGLDLEAVPRGRKIPWDYQQVSSG